MQSFFLSVAPATIWKVGAKFEKVCSKHSFGVSFNCKHMLNTFVELKIIPSWGSRL